MRKSDMKIKIQIVEGGEVVEEGSFEGIVAVGFNGEMKDDIVARLYGGDKGASIIAGYLSASDFVVASKIVRMIKEESLAELSIDENDIDLGNYEM